MKYLKNIPSIPEDVAVEDDTDPTMVLRIFRGNMTVMMMMMMMKMTKGLTNMYISITELNYICIPQH